MGDEWKQAMAESMAAWRSKPPPPPPDPGLVGTFRVSFDELGAHGEDAPVDLYRALRDMARRTGAGMFRPTGPAVDFITQLAGSAKSLKVIEVKANGLDRAQCIAVRSALDAAARRAALDDISQASVAPLRALVLAWERFADVRTNDPRSPAEQRQAQRPERGWITY